MKIINQGKIPTIGRIDFLAPVSPHHSLSHGRYIIRSHLHPFLEIGEDRHFLDGRGGCSFDGPQNSPIGGSQWGIWGGVSGIADGGGVCCGCSDDLLSFEMFVGDSLFATGSFFCAVVVERAACQGLVGSTDPVRGFAAMHHLLRHSTPWSAGSFFLCPYAVDACWAAVSLNVDVVTRS
jgi:hypothetical protein